MVCHIEIIVLLVFVHFGSLFWLTVLLNLNNIKTLWSTVAQWAGNTQSREAKFIHKPLLQFIELC